LQPPRPLRNHFSVESELDPARKNPSSQKRMTMPWIRTQDQMPKKGQVVLITDKEGEQNVAWIDMYTGKWHSENHRWWPREVVYWMPIPELPKP